MEIIIGTLLILAFVGFLNSACAEPFPNMPPDSVTVLTEDGSIYGKIIFKLREGENPPFWMGGSYVPQNYYAYVHYENNHRFDTIDHLNLIFAAPQHNALIHGPKKAYLRIGESNFFSTEPFDNFHLEMTNFDRNKHIFVTMPRGPVFSAKLVKRTDWPVCIVTPQLSEAYSRGAHWECTTRR